MNATDLSLVLGQQVVDVRAPSFAEVCNLNQMDLLNQLGKLPAKLFWLLAIATACLILYNLVLPLFKTWAYKVEAEMFLLNLAMALMLFASVLCAALVFNLDAEFWGIVEGVMFVILLVAVVWRIISWKKKKSI